MHALCLVWNGCWVSGWRWGRKCKDSCYMFCSCRVKYRRKGEFRWEGMIEPKSCRGSGLCRKGCGREDVMVVRSCWSWWKCHRILCWIQRLLGWKMRTRGTLSLFHQEGGVSSLCVIFSSISLKQGKGKTSRIFILEYFAAFHLETCACVRWLHPCSITK